MSIILHIVCDLRNRFFKFNFCSLPFPSLHHQLVFHEFQNAQVAFWSFIYLYFFYILFIVQIKSIFSPSYFVNIHGLKGFSIASLLFQSHLILHWFDESIHHEFSNSFKSCFILILIFRYTLQHPCWEYQLNYHHRLVWLGNSKD